MADLLKCPFCGGEAKLRSYEDFNKDFSSVYKFYIQCKDCEAQSKPIANVENAVNTWNTRKPMEAVVAELEEMKCYGSGCLGVSCDKCKYNESCLEGEEAFRVALDNAIEVVSNGGKE